MRCSLLVLRCVLCAMLGAMACAVAAGQEAPATKAEAEAQLPVIADEPRTIDPATLVPEKLAVRATADFSDASLNELVAWLQEQQKLAVVLKGKDLDDAGISANEPISDRLNDEPIYLLLNRLRSLELDWYYEDDVLYITSAEDAQTRLVTVPYNLGDLLDAGYEVDALQSAITGTIAPASWDSVGGPGALSIIGDVMFVGQTESVQRQVQGLLAALRKHGRQTFVGEPPQHLTIWQKLEENVSADFQDKPLEAAVEELAGISGVDIRLDLPALRDVGLRERTPVSVKLADRKLKIVLQALVHNLDLTWNVRDGVLWVTTPDIAEAAFKTAVYDVRDLCRDDAESEALADAITTQSVPTSWDCVGGPGSLVFAKPGTMVVSNEERVLARVLDLLETYRAALRDSKIRDRNAVDPKEVITVYYRMHAAMADDLEKILKLLVQPETWKTAERPEAAGAILRVTSAPDLTELGSQGEPGEDGSAASKLVASRAVLIVTQTRAAHEEIAEVIRRVQSGDPSAGSGAGMGGMGGGMGGFGGGFFSVPAEK